MKLNFFNEKRIYFVCGLVSAHLLFIFCIFFIRQANIEAYSTIVAAMLALVGIWLGYQIDQKIKLKNIKAALSVDFGSYVENINFLLTQVKPDLEEMVLNKAKQQILIEKVDGMLNRVGILYNIENDNWGKSKSLFIKTIKIETYKKINEYINKIAYIQLQINFIRKNLYEQQARKADYVIQKVVDFSKEHPILERFVIPISKSIENGDSNSLTLILAQADYQNERQKYLNALNGFIFQVQQEGYAYRSIHYYLELNNSLEEIKKIEDIEVAIKEFAEFSY